MKLNYCEVCGSGFPYGYNESIKLSPDWSNGDHRVRVDVESNDHLIQALAYAEAKNDVPTKGKYFLSCEGGYIYIEPYNLFEGTAAPEWLEEFSDQIKIFKRKMKREPYPEKLDHGWAPITIYASWKFREWGCGKEILAEWEELLDNRIEYLFSSEEMEHQFRGVRSFWMRLCQEHGEDWSLSPINMLTAEYSKVSGKRHDELV